MSLSEEEKARLVKCVRKTKNKILEFPADYRKYLLEVNRYMEHVNTSEGDVDVYVFSSIEKTGCCPLYIYIHGGGFCRGRSEKDDLFSAYIARNINGVVIDIDYSLAPEHPYPTAFNECYEICRWAFTKLPEWRVSISSVVLGGHSAGANIASAICLKNASTKEFDFCLLDLNYGCFDFTADASVKKDIEKSVIPLPLINDFTTSYLDGDMDKAKDIFISPLLASEDLISTFPPTLVITASEDVFNEEGLCFARRLADVGIEVTMRKFIGSEHGFIPECKGSWQEADRLICSAIKTYACNIR